MSIYLVSSAERQGPDSRRCDTMRRLEQLALDVVQQLFGALPAPGDLNGRQCRNKRIIVQLADRRKPMQEDGCVGYTSTCSRVHSQRPPFEQIFWHQKPDVPNEHPACERKKSRCRLGRIYPPSVLMHS